MSRYLAQQAEARGAGIGEFPVNEVEPYEAAAFPLVEPRTAWDEAVAAVRLLDPENARLDLSPPADWSGVISGLDSISALSFASGNFPQLVRDLPVLIRSARRSELQPKCLPAVDGSSLESWAKQVARKGELPNALVAIGLLRLARQFEAADRVVLDLRAKAGSRWQSALANEEAALAWHRGDADKAAALWSKLPDSAPVCFNRGMSSLFRDQPAAAKTALTQAVALLPETDAWHHLARLYLALAGI
jgi:hypothetical protein